MNSTQINPLLQYCLKMNMSYSYKPVLIMSMLENNGKITMSEAASYFASYYGSRLTSGLVAEKSNSIYCNLNCSFETIRQNIISNPVRALTNSSALFAYNVQDATLEIDHSIWRNLSHDDIEAARSACLERLDRYYASITKRALCPFQYPDGENGYLSNDYQCEFVFSGNTFINMTQYMSFRKAQMLGLDNRSRQLLEATNPSNIATMHRELRSMHSCLWDGQKQLVAYQGLISKFTQNDDIAIELLNTGSSLIVACLPDDPTWGIGLDIHNSSVPDVERWSGKNLLGYSLMQVRNMVFYMRSL